MEQVQTEFLKVQKHKPLVWFCYLDDVFFIWTHGKETLSLFLEDFNNFHTNIIFSLEVNKESIHFLDLNIRLSDGNILTDCMLKLQTDINFSTIHRLIQITPSAL